jgi:AcrR family transcriptional regulator
MAPAPKYSHEKQLEMILDAAEECIKASSVMDFTMAKVAKTAGLSMGSVYKHVQSKEDIILALAHGTFLHVSNIFNQVLALPLTTPEKVLAISLISPRKLQYFVFDKDLLSYAVNEAVIRRASHIWTDKMIVAHNACERSFKVALTEGINSGDLNAELNLSHAIEEIILGSWAMCVGHDQVQRVKQIQQIGEGTDSLMEPLTENDPIIRSSIRFLNSYPWKKPLNEASVRTLIKTLEDLNLR